MIHQGMTLVHACSCNRASIRFLRRGSVLQGNPDRNHRMTIPLTMSVRNIVKKLTNFINQGGKW